MHFSLNLACSCAYICVHDILPCHVFHFRSLNRHSRHDQSTVNSLARLLLDRFAPAVHLWTLSIALLCATLLINAVECDSLKKCVWQDQSTINSFASALYWVGLNFATLCRLGGGGQYSAQQACDVAFEAVEVAHSMINDGTPAHRIAELYFVQGVLSFCRSESIQSGEMLAVEKPCTSFSVVSGL